jgi:hypothetical protein
MMRALFVAVIVLGSNVGAGAIDIDADYRAYFDDKPAAVARTKPKGMKRKPHPIEALDERRFDDGDGPGTPANLRPGYRNGAGLYVPPTYSTNPHDPSGSGFGSSPNDSYGSLAAPNPFSGTLGTRR